jgi:hypothetical protein
MDLVFGTGNEVMSTFRFHRHLFQVIRKLKSIICRFVLRVMQTVRMAGRGTRVGYCCKWVLTVSNSGSEFRVKVLGRVT